MHLLAFARLVALTLASGSSILVAAWGWSEAALPSNGGKGASADLLVYLLIAATYTLAAVAALHGLSFWLDALG